MSKQEKRKRNWILMVLFTIILIITITVSIGIYRYLNPLSPENWTRTADSNLTVQGIITKIELNHKSEGFSTYHVFPAVIVINITQVVRVDEDFQTENIQWDNTTWNSFPTLTIAYDQPYLLNLQTGQLIECRGRYISITDSAYSFKVIVSSYIQESYIRML
ncbi:MAG: hypothetical protein ACPLRY_02490 [Candidatus Bathyarchaeales archaeon]